MGNICFSKTKEYMYDKYEGDYLIYRVPLVNGKKNGIQTNYTKNGDILCTTEYLNGKFHGLFQLFSSDGTLQQETSFRYGKKHGPEYYFLKNNMKSESTLGFNIVASHALYRRGLLLYKRNYSIAEMNEIEECCICLEETNFKLFCSHTVCPSCTKKIERCPICRKFLQELLYLVD